MAFATRKAGSRRQLGKEVVRGCNFPAAEQAVEAGVSLLHQPLVGKAALNARGHTSLLISKYIITSTSTWLFSFPPDLHAPHSFLASVTLQYTQI